MLCYAAILYNKVTSVCILLVVERDLLKDTHTDDVRSLVFLFSFPKNPSIDHLKFYFKTI